MSDTLRSALTRLAQQVQGLPSPIIEYPNNFSGHGNYSCQWCGAKWFGPSAHPPGTNCLAVYDWPALIRMAESVKEATMTEVTDKTSYDDLCRLSIRLGCETEFNRKADAELRRRGYHFMPDLQMWVLTLDIQDDKLVQVAPTAEEARNTPPALPSRARIEAALTDLRYVRDGFTYSLDEGWRTAIADALENHIPHHPTLYKSHDEQHAKDAHDAAVRQHLPIVTSVIFANLTEAEMTAFHTHHVLYSGSTGNYAKGYEPYGPYIATSIDQLSAGLQAMGWDVPKIGFTVSIIDMGLDAKTGRRTQQWTVRRQHGLAEFTVQQLVMKLKQAEMIAGDAKHQNERLVERIKALTEPRQPEAQTCSSCKFGSKRAGCYACINPVVAENSGRTEWVNHQHQKAVFMPLDFGCTLHAAREPATKEGQ